MTQANENTQDELKRRHRATLMVIGGFIVLTLLLLVVAFVSHEALYRPLGPPALPGALRIAILFFGFGAITLRRTRFSAMRLQDIAALRGISGLLATLQGTTVQVAMLGLAIALMGFIGTILTNNEYEMLRAGLIAIAVLLYCYPRLSAWQRVVRGIEQTGDANASSVKGSDA
ncbi:MAG TPA: hypothetical protein VIW80_05405 [Pyrinomonadaceae bacterium]